MRKKVGGEERWRKDGGERVLFHHKYGKSTIFASCHSTELVKILSVTRVLWCMWIILQMFYTVTIYSLPFKVRSSNTLTSFKPSLKSHLFKLSSWLCVCVCVCVYVCVRACVRACVSVNRHTVRTTANLEYCWSFCCWFSVVIMGNLL